MSKAVLSLSFFEGRCVFVCVHLYVCLCVLRVCLHVSGQDPCGASTALRPHLGVFLKPQGPACSWAAHLPREASVSWEVTRGH